MLGIFKKAKGKLDPKVVQALAPFEKGTVQFYRKAWEICEYDKGHEKQINEAAKLVLKSKLIYQEAVKGTQIPWWFIGILHFKEATCRFTGVLHNGDKIIGTGKLTHNVPKGRGPFNTWAEATADLIAYKRMHLITNWELGQMFFTMERYNGKGYLTGAGARYNDNSAYLYACSNINDDFGKYPSDGVYDPEAPTNKTVGGMPLLKEMMKLDSTITVQIAA